MKKNELLKTLVIMVSTVVVTVGLAILLNLYTGPKIAANKAAAESGALVAVMPEGTAFEEITSTLTIDANSGVSAVYKETSGKGYVFMASAPGFSSPVNVTVGVDASGKIVGIDVVIGAGDYGVGNMPQTFIGQDSTLSGVVMHAGATTSSTAVKTAVSNGLTVLALNNLMKAAVKTTEQVYEELLPTVYNGFVKGEDLTASGNIAVAYTSNTGNGVVCYVTKGEQTLLVLYNVSGAVAVYQAKLIDETTQVYELEEVTADIETVVAEVSSFAASHVTSNFAALETKIAEMYANATEITEVSVNAFGTIVSAASFEVEGATYYAYYSKPLNGFEGDLMNVYVVLDSTGKIAKFDVTTYFYGEHLEYFAAANSFNPENYKEGLNGVTGESYNGSQSLISGATFTTKALDAAVKDVFKAFASQGGNE